MVIVKVCLRMILICIMVANPIFSIYSSKWQIKLKIHHQLFYWLKIVQFLEVIFEEFARRLLSNTKILSSSYSRVDKICERYFHNSRKNLARNKRDHDPKLLFNDKTPLPSQFNDSFFKNNDNKKRLNLHCADKFQSYQEDAQSFNVTKVNPFSPFQL